MKKLIALYIGLMLIPLLTKGMEIDYGDFLENALRAEFTDLPEIKTLKELKILYA